MDDAGRELLGPQEGRIVLTRRMSSCRHRRGVTLPELLVGMAIVAILLGMGVPSIATYLQSAKLHSAAQSYLAGIQLARSEAIRRNMPVEFVLTDTPVLAGVENAAVPSISGLNWVVRVFDPVASTFELIEAKSVREGSPSAAAPSVTIAGTGNPTLFTGVVAFNGFGSVANASTYEFNIENPAGGTCALSGGTMRCMRIRVPAGGQIRLCDPATANVTDSRGCGA